MVLGEKKVRIEKLKEIGFTVEVPKHLSFNQRKEGQIQLKAGAAQHTRTKKKNKIKATNGKILIYEVVNHPSESELTASPTALKTILKQ